MIMHSGIFKSKITMMIMIAIYSIDIIIIIIITKFIIHPPPHRPTTNNSVLKVPPQLLPMLLPDLIPRIQHTVSYQKK